MLAPCTCTVKTKITTCVNTEFLWLRVHPVDRERSCTPAYRAIRLSDIVLRYIVDFLYGRVRVS